MKVKIVHNGIDTNVFKPCAIRDDIKKEYGIKEDRIVLSVASHIMTDTNKGARYVIQLAEELKKNSIHFLLVGSDESKIDKNDNVTIIPAVRDQYKLAKLYSAADVFLISSESENFPTTCIEAQCSGTPVCGFDVGGVKETLVESALLCQYDDLSTLKKNICALINEKELGTISELSSKSAALFGKNRMLNAYYSLSKEDLRD